MKNKTKKIAQYSVLALAASAVLPMACKKETKVVEVVDDPNITVKSFNLTVAATLNANNDMPFDIDGDAVNDFGVKAFFTDYGTYNEGTFFENINSNNKILSNTVSSKRMATTLSVGSQIDSTLTTWYGFGYGSFKNTTPLDLGVNGQGDKYTACKFKIGANFHYGWLKFEVTNSGRTITLKETAYDIRPNTAIKVGAK